MPASRVHGALVRAAFRMLGVWSPARDYLAQMRYKPKPQFRAGPDLAQRTVPRAAPRLAGCCRSPEVENAARDRMLLDAALPDAPVVPRVRRIPRGRAAGCGACRATGCERNGGSGSYPSGAIPAPNPPFAILRDVGRLLSVEPFRSCLGQAVLIRRDRYVAATCPAAEADALLGPPERALPYRDARERPPLY